MGLPLTLDALEVLDAIDRRGSYAAAARALHRVPSAISYTVQKLEQELGFTVFRREGRRSVLTPAGRLLLEQGREILLATERLADRARQLDSGWEPSLNIAVDTLLGVETVFPAIATFYQLQPQIEINLHEEVLGGPAEALREGRVDLAVGVATLSGDLSRLRQTPIAALGFCVAVAPQHPLAAIEGPVSEQALEQFRVVVVRDSARNQAALTRGLFTRQPVLSVSSMEYKIAAQVAGLGVGHLPRHRIQSLLERGELVEIELQQDHVEVPLHLVWRQGGQGQALRWFIDYFRDWQQRGELI